MDGLRQLVVVLLWLSLPHPALADACEEAPLMLVHPAVALAYQPVIDQLAEGLAQAAEQPIAVCALQSLNAGSWSRPPGFGFPGSHKSRTRFNTVPGSWPGPRCPGNPRG